MICRSSKAAIPIFIFILFYIFCYFSHLDKAADAHGETASILVLSHSAINTVIQHDLEQHRQTCQRRERNMPRNDSLPPHSPLLSYPTLSLLSVPLSRPVPFLSPAANKFLCTLNSETAPGDNDFPSLQKVTNILKKSNENAWDNQWCSQGIFMRQRQRLRQTVAEAEPRRDRRENCLEAVSRQGSCLEDYITGDNTTAGGKRELTTKAKMRKTNARCTWALACVHELHAFKLSWVLSFCWYH